MFPTVNRVLQGLQAWVKYPQRQTVLIRKIVDRIRNSLELQVVLQTAVDEVAALLRVDYCSFLWFFEDTQRVKIVCERNNGNQKTSHLGYQSLERFGSVANAIATGKLIINSGIRNSSAFRWEAIVNQFPGLKYAVSQRVPSRAGSLQEKCNLLGYSASLLIPVTGQEGAMGFLACFAEQPRFWSAGEIEFLQSIAEPLEVALRQAQLYQQTQKQAIREQLVNQITTQTRQSFDPEIILTEAIAQLLEALQVDRCLVHLVEDTNNLEMAEHHSESSSITNSCNAFQRKHLYEVCRPPFSSSVDNFDPHGPITQWVIDHRQLVVIPDTAQDQRIGKVNQEYQQAHIKSSLVVPVQANGTLHALLYLNQCSYIRYWSKHDQQLAQAVADQLAISLQQAYLYTCTQQQAYRSSMQAQQMSEMLEELRLAQAQLIQSEKMSSLGRIVAGVAHEINNPINFIYGNIPYIENYVNQLLRLVQAYQTHYPQPSYPIQKLAEETDIDFLLRDLPKILKSMEVGAERIHEVVKLLQKFAGSNLAPLKVIDINAALESTLLILHNQITGIIKLERHYDNLPPVECYPRQINQTFLSILTNAIEALNRSPSPDKILTLQTRWIPSREKGDGGLVQIAIRDNGPGIKLEIQPKIFEPFFTTKDIGQGRGLGLTMSYHTVVNQHNGQIEVVSQSGQGAEFLLTIPIRPTQSLTSNLFSYKEISLTSQATVSTSNEKSVAAATNS
ncbi:MAG: GAF domain-containing protein [Coleofasciculus sp. Co-bin14]|nr:GAF domain-containing protein [Coleofasciculus sp. Co-bin14]